MNGSTRTAWLVVVIFAAAMAWVEAACVYDLRVLVDRLEPYQPNPLPMTGRLGGVELLRELATLVMLAAVGALAGRTLRTRVAYAAIAFGVWDVFYYVWLKAIYGWPASLLDWDILFLLPLPWWGPVAAPIAIALLLIVAGTVTVLRPTPRGISRSRWSAAALGAALALYVFMADALRAMPGGANAVQSVLPARFNWPAFAVAFVLMTLPVAPLFQSMNREIDPEGEPPRA